MNSQSPCSPSILDRRRFLQTGGACSLAAAASVAFEAGILLWLAGGLSPLDSFDPKPDAPPDIRGPFRSRPTSLPGVEISEHLPGLAEWMDRVTLFRALQTDETNHDRATHLALTGSRKSAASACFVGERLAAGEHAMIPSLPYGLPREIEPVLLSKPAAAGLGVSDLREACLRALSAVEAGTRWVTVVDVGWDHHESLSAALPEKLKSLDRALTFLLERLDQRRMFERTLVVVMSEFGRAPRLNAFGGRDHWPQCFCALMAGGPVGRGVVVGESDATGAYPVGLTLSPPQLLERLTAAMGQSLSLEERQEVV